ncbi:hypothetical protein BH10PSE15_BH10PSE15_14580 [soil metagenome]
MRRTIVELLFLALGLGVAALIASLSVWAVPGTGRTVWTVAYVAMVLEAVLQIGPIRRAWRRDHAQPAVPSDG